MCRDTTNLWSNTMKNNAAIVTWPNNEEAVSPHYAVRINGQDVLVHQARVSAVPFNQTWPGYQRGVDQTELSAFAAWDMTGPVDVEILSKRPVETIIVRPQSYGISHKIDGDRIRFTLAKPGFVTVEVNGPNHALHLFAGEPEQNVPDQKRSQRTLFRPRRT